MLPQTRHKLRLFAGLALVIGCGLVAALWFAAKPDVIVPGTPVPGFRDIILVKIEITDEIQWKILDLSLSHGFFCNLIRFLIVATIFTSGITLVTIYNDTRLTKK